MDQRLSDAPEQVRNFAPKDQPLDDDATDEAGHALLAMVQQAAGLSSETCERATRLADKLAGELLAVEQRIKELEGVIFHYHDRARRAEEWLQRIEREIEDKLIAPQAASRPGPPKMR